MTEEASYDLMKMVVRFTQEHPQSACLKRYLVRLLATKHQQNAVVEWRRRGIYPDLLPEELLRMAATDSPDVFLIIDPAYKEIRDAVGRGWLTGDYASLANLLVMHSNNSKAWSLTFHALTRVNPAVLKDVAAFDSFVLQHKWLQQIWIKNETGCPALVDKTHRHVAVHSLLVHMSAVLADDIQQLPQLVQIFGHLARTPSACQNLYLPTMPQDETFEAKEAVGAAVRCRWFLCSNNHAYAIGECGQPMETGKCPSCGVTVGGANHAFANGQNVQQAQITDGTKPGHLLGEAGTNGRSITVREISGLEVAIIRFLLHIAMLEGCQEKAADVARLIVPLPRADVTEFLVAHLLLNLRQISDGLDKNEDDVVVLLHQIIEGLARTSHTPGGLTFNTKDAKEAKAAVRQWEKEFAQHIIGPALRGLETTLARHRIAIREDNEEAGSVLLDILHESPETTTDKRKVLQLPQLWQPHEDISLARVESKLGGTAKFKDRCPMLYHLLSEELVLQQLVHLPQLLQLVKFMKGKFNRKLEPTETEKPVLAFLKTHMDAGEIKLLLPLVNTFFSVFTQLRIKLYAAGW
jgi:hypothetical protein